MTTACIIAILLASPTTFEVELGRDANATIVSSSDGSLLDVEVVTAGESVRLRELQVPPAVTASIQQVGKRHVWLTFSTDRAFTSATVRPGRVATLVVTVAGREEPLRARLLSRTPELGGALGVVNGLKPAEQAIGAQRFADAARALAQIPDGAPVHAWAVLRAADVDILSGELVQGCNGYGDVVDRYHDRTVSLVARMRRVGFGCGQNVPIDWTDLLATIRGLDGSLGLWLGREAVLVMQTLATPAAVDAALAANVQGGALRVNANAIRDVLTARSVASRRGKPIELVTWVTDNGERVVKHPDAAMIRLETARAFHELDLHQRAIAVLAPMLDGSLPRPDAPLGVWKILLDSYGAIGDANALTALSAAFALAKRDRLESAETMAPAPSQTTVQELDGVFVSLERRLQRLRRHLGKEAP